MRETDHAGRRADLPPSEDSESSRNDRDRASGGTHRRGFLAAAAAGAAGALAGAEIGSNPAAAANRSGSGAGAVIARRRRDAGREQARAHLDAVAPSRETLDAFRDPKSLYWAKFDPELGYLLRNAFVRDGVDGAFTLGRYDEPDGPRRTIQFADQPCRIHTYGDSFTQGHQVSDGETWQEVLAAHFCEPIRNYGIGGFGVYQAYRRLLRIEDGPDAKSRSQADRLVFNIWGDDHWRSVYAWRWASFPPEVAKSMEGPMFHANPWAHARIDPATGGLEERPSLCPTPESLDNLTNREFLYERFEDDEILRLNLAILLGRAADPEPLERLAALTKRPAPRFDDPEALKEDARRILNAYAVRVGELIFERLIDRVAAMGKKLFVLLSYPMANVWNACNGGARDAAGFVDWHPPEFQAFLRARGVPVVDTIEKHVADFAAFKLTPKEYVDRYYIGHYTPTGNHFYAFAVKDDLLAWLDPKPPAYRGADRETLIRFRGYLPG